VNISVCNRLKVGAQEKKNSKSNVGIPKVTEILLDALIYYANFYAIFRNTLHIGQCMAKNTARKYAGV
jgi:hypothetical protein